MTEVERVLKETIEKGLSTCQLRMLARAINKIADEKDKDS